MMSSLASAGISSWNGPSSLAGTNRVVDDAFLVPGNATVIDAWLHTDETGYLQDGEGMTWTGEDAPGNFSAGQFSDTLIGKFDGAMSLSPDSSVSNIQTFSSASLQLPLGWSQAGGLWEAVNPTSMGGTVAGNTRTLAHGYVPAAAYGGGVVAGTLPGQGLPASSSGTLTAPAFNLPSPINHFNMTFQHWHHLDVDDGAWVEYKLDNGNWNYLEPVGGYPDVISNSAPMPNGVNSSGFGVFGDGNHSGWTQAVFNLDNLTGISSATTMQFRFKVWTAANSTARPGWFLDEFDVENIGNAVGFWHHGCYVQTGTCTYSNYAAGQLTTDIDLSNTTTGSQVHTRLEWDLEGSSYDNFCVELSKDNGQTWTDISSNSGGSTTSGCRLRTGAIPGSGYTMPNGTFLSDESGGFVLLELDIPTAFIGVNSSLIKFWVETDSSVQYGGSTDSKEGLTLDWFKVVDSSGTNLSYDALDNTTSITTSLGPGGTNNDWSFILIGAGGLSISDGLEDAPALPPGGWSIQNVAGQTGWEFGAICTNYTDGPSGFPSANLGFGTNLCGDYDASSDNSLISPSYSVPLGASARFVWKHWMCSEDGWDGGALHISVNGGTWSQAYVNLGNNTTWYDGSIVYGPFVGTDVWDGRHHVAASGQWGCTSSANIPWVDMAYDVSSYSGNNVSFKFQQMSDTAVQEPGWYVDDIGLEVDWFESDGTWMSPLIPTNDLGYAFVDADVVLPNGTWYGVNVLDATGQVIAGHENLSLPLSLASIDRDQHQGVFIEMMLGTEDPYFTPLVRELTVGATRYFGDSNGWNVPSVIQRNSNGSWVNTAGNTQVITGDSGLSTRPISSAMVTGNFSQVTASLLKSGTQSVSATTTNSILDLDGMRNHVSPKVTLAPGAVIDTLAFRGTFALPAHDAAIDLANDGTDDWVFPANPSYGSLGWQTRIDDTAISHSESFTGSDTMSVLIPEDAIPRSLLIGITANGASSPITLSSGSNPLQSVQTANWSSAVLSVENPQFVASSTHVDSFGRNWSMIDIDFSTSSTTSYTVGSFSIGYTLFENTSGLGQVVKTYHEANSNNGLEPTVEVPLTWSATAGGAMVTGGVHHENMITNYPFTVPETWYPNGMLQGFISQHRHLIDNDLIDEIHLIGQDSSGDSVGVILSDITNGGTFTQSSGFGMLKLSNTSSVSELNGRLNVDWQFDVDWDWNDSTSMSWTAQGFDADGEGLSPATALSGGIGTQASENDLQVDTWQVVDLYGHTLSDMFSPSYPFWAKSGTQVSVSGTVRFENTLDMRPLQDDFVVAVNVAGTDSILSSTGDGIWTGLVDLPMNMSEVNMTAYVLRAGPIAGADGAEDVTLQTPVRVLLDDESPRVSNLQVNNGQRLLAADGYTWDPASSLSLQVTISDQQALGDELVLHTWREGADDANSNGVADPSEYQTRSESLPEGIAGDRTVTFSGIDVSGLDMNAQLSIYFTATDYSGHELVDGGSPGIDNDMATMVIAVNEPTEIPTSGLSLDTIDDMLMVGHTHTLSMEISDLNGVDSIDVVTVKMLGADEDTVGVMTWEPRNGAMYTPEGSMLTLHGVQTTDMGDYFLVEWDFTLDWDFDESLLSEYSLPGIVVFDDDDLNPVELMTNLGEIRWQLDNDLEVVVENMSDNTPPISMNSAEHIYVQPGDDLTISGMVRFAGTKAPITQLPPQGLEVQVSTDYGSVLVSESALHDQAVMNALKSLAKDNFEFKPIHGDSYNISDRD